MVFNKMFCRRLTKGLGLLICITLVLTSILFSFLRELSGVKVNDPNQKQQVYHSIALVLDMMGTSCASLMVYSSVSSSNIDEVFLLSPRVLGMRLMKWIAAVVGAGLTMLSMFVYATIIILHTIYYKTVPSNVIFYYGSTGALLTLIGGFFLYSVVLESLEGLEAPRKLESSFSASEIEKFAGKFCKKPIRKLVFDIVIKYLKDNVEKMTDLKNMKIFVVRKVIRNNLSGLQPLSSSKGFQRIPSGHNLEVEEVITEKLILKALFLMPFVVQFVEHSKSGIRYYGLTWKDFREYKKVRKRNVKKDGIENEKSEQTEETENTTENDVLDTTEHDDDYYGSL